MQNIELAAACLSPCLPVSWKSLAQVPREGRCRWSKAGQKGRPELQKKRQMRRELSKQQRYLTLTRYSVRLCLCQLVPKMTRELPFGSKGLDFFFFPSSFAFLFFFFSFLFFLPPSLPPLPFLSPPLPSPLLSSPFLPSFLLGGHHCPFGRSLMSDAYKECWHWDRTPPYQEFQGKKGP